MSGEGPGREREPSDERGAIETALGNPLLRELEPRVRAEVRMAFRVRHHASGSLLFGFGDPADSIFVVGSGAVDCFHGGNARERALPRRVRAGELFGEEALAPGTRRERAVAVGACALVEIPVPVLRRAAERSFGTRLYREERRARRLSFRHLLASTTLGEMLPSAAFEALFAALGEEAHVRGTILPLSGQCAHLIADGLFRVKESGAAEPCFRARGEFLGLAAALGREPTSETAEVLASAFTLTLPSVALKELSFSAPKVIDAALSKQRAAVERQRRVLHTDPSKKTRLVVNDLERLESAGSLLSIDLDLCTRCGQCVRACADTHGESRLLRQGEKVIATLRTETEPHKTALLFPSACQHCHEPACLAACPTGAIVREPSGTVLIREDLCTGCGACATACPWDAVRMSVRGTGAAPARVAGVVSAAVATKCDSCDGRDAPACVQACPTSAIFRLQPKRDVLELGALSLGIEANGRDRKGRAGAFSRSRPTSPAVFVARAAAIPPLLAVFFLAFERGDSGVRLSAGIAAGVLGVFLAAQALVKRNERIRSRVAHLLLRERRSSVLRPLLAAHSLLGLFALGCALVHTGFRVPSGVAGLLSLAFYGSALTGAVGAVLYRTLPPRITRLERSVTLPEDGARELSRLLDRLFAETTGQNPALKRLLFGVLIPYVRSWTGVCLLLLSGRSLAEEVARLTRRIDSLLAGRKSSRLSGAASLLDTAVAMRALKAKRVLEWIIDAFVPLHLACASITLILLLAHSVGALR